MHLASERQAVLFMVYASIPLTKSLQLEISHSVEVRLESPPTLMLALEG